MTTIWIETLTIVDGEWKWVPQVENINTEDDFSIDESNLNFEICRMGQLMARYGDLAARMMANLKRKEEQVKYVQARVSAALRSSAETSGNKMTENKLQEQVVLDQQYQQVLSELHILRADALRVEHWWKGIVKKAELLNGMAYRQYAEIKKMPG